MLRGYSPKAGQEDGLWQPSVLMHMRFARMLEFKAFLGDPFFCSWERHCVMFNAKYESLPYSDYQKQLEIIVVILSFKLQSKHSFVVAKKQNTCEV